jgi:hypothetical protein
MYVLKYVKAQAILHLQHGSAMLWEPGLQQEPHHRVHCCSDSTPSSMLFTLSAHATTFQRSLDTLKEYAQKIAVTMIEVNCCLMSYIKLGKVFMCKLDLSIADLGAMGVENVSDTRVRKETSKRRRIRNRMAGLDRRRNFE